MKTPNYVCKPSLLKILSLPQLLRISKFSKNPISIRIPMMFHNSSKVGDTEWELCPHIEYRVLVGEPFGVFG